MVASPASMGGDRNLRAGANKPGLLTLTIKDKSALYLAYMPFVKNGGLFIPTNSNYRLGDEVFMLLNLMGEDEKLPVAGRVIWVTPKGAQGNRASARPASACSSPSRTAARPRRRSRPISPVRSRATRPRTRCSFRAVHAPGRSSGPVRFSRLTSITTVLAAAAAERQAAVVIGKRDEATHTRHPRADEPWAGQFRRLALQYITSGCARAGSRACRRPRRASAAVPRHRCRVRP